MCDGPHSGFKALMSEKVKKLLKSTEGLEKLKKIIRDVSKRK
jgi:hypothetical protein